MTAVATLPRPRNLEHPRIAEAPPFRPKPLQRARGPIGGSGLSFNEQERRYVVEFVFGPQLLQLDQMRRLPPNWDTYGSVAIRPDAIEDARRVLDIEVAIGGEHLAFPRANVYPLADGAVGFEWADRGREMTVRCYGSGRFDVYTESDGETHSDVENADRDAVAVAFRWLLQ